MLDAIEAGAEDIQQEDGDLIVLTEPANLHQVKTWLEEKGLTAETAELQMIATTYTQIDDSNREQLEQFIETIEDHDDVNKVWNNIEFI